MKCLQNLYVYAVIHNSSKSDLFGFDLEVANRRLHLTPPILVFWWLIPRGEDGHSARIWITHWNTSSFTQQHSTNKNNKKMFWFFEEQAESVFKKLFCECNMCYFLLHSIAVIPQKPYFPRRILLEEGVSSFEQRIPIRQCEYMLDSKKTKESRKIFLNHSKLIFFDIPPNTKE